MRRSERLEALALIARDLTTCDNALMTACDNALRWSGLGYPASSTLEGQRGYAHDPVGALVAAGARDDFARDLAGAEARLDSARRAMAWLARFSLRNTRPATRLDDGGLTECANPRCDRYMTGLGNDRPRDGRCVRCYSWRRRYGEDWPMRSVIARHPSATGLDIVSLVVDEPGS